MPAVVLVPRRPDAGGCGVNDLQIPTAAIRATYAGELSRDVTNRQIEEILQLAAPYLVAAELRRIASQWERRSDNIPLGRNASREQVSRVGDLREFADLLRVRADELDGGVA